jgi:hypothetical protein
LDSDDEDLDPSKRQKIESLDESEVENSPEHVFEEENLPEHRSEEVNSPENRVDNYENDSQNENQEENNSQNENSSNNGSDDNNEVPIDPRFIEGAMRTPASFNYASDDEIVEKYKGDPKGLFSSKERAHDELVGTESKIISNIQRTWDDTDETREEFLDGLQAQYSIAHDQIETKYDNMVERLNQEDPDTNYTRNTPTPTPPPYETNSNEGNVRLNQDLSGENSSNQGNINPNQDSSGETNSNEENIGGNQGSSSNEGNNNENLGPSSHERGGDYQDSSDITAEGEPMDFDDPTG